MNTRHNAAREKSRQLALQFWDQASKPNADLSKRYHLLNTSWNEFLKILATELGYDTSAFRPKDWLNFINEKLEIGVSDMALAKSIGFFSINYHKTRQEYKAQTNRNISSEALENKGYDLKKYKELLYKVSQYYAAVSGKKIPDDIIKLCDAEKTPEPDVIIDFTEDDLAEISCSKFLVAFVIDTGISMEKVLPKVQEGLNFLIDLIKTNERYRQQIELCVTTTGDADGCLLPFTSVRPGKDFSPLQSIRAFGPGRISDALKRASAAIIDRSGIIQQIGFEVYCPWIIVISEGQWQPKYNADLDEVSRDIAEKASEKVFKTFARSISERENLSENRLLNLAKIDPNFESMRDEKKFFSTAFQSMQALLRQSPSIGQGVDLPNSNGI